MVLLLWDRLMQRWGPQAPSFNVEPSQQGDLGFLSPELMVIDPAAGVGAVGHLFRAGLSSAMGQEEFRIRPQAS